MQGEFFKSEGQALFGKLIAVTNRNLCERTFEEQLGRVAALKPRAIILREKDLPEAAYRELAATFLQICARGNVKGILHSFTGVARELGCKALHLPLSLLEKCSAELRDFDTVGASVHSVGEALRAEQLGATYLSAGHVFATACKPGLAPRGLDFLRQVAHAVKIPVYGIGGIRLDEAQLELLLKTGAAGGCVMSGFMKA